MNKAEGYQNQYNEVFKVMNASSEDHVNSLSFLVEDMLETIYELEKRNCEQALYLANAKRTQKAIQQFRLGTSND